MSTIKAYSMAGEESGAVELGDGLLARDKGSQAVHDAVVAHLAARRAGTASTLSKGEVAGSGRKPWRQKGTGRARAGYRQSPVWRGGAVAFGPKPRDYSVKVNKRVARLAFRRAFTEKVDAGAVRVLDELAIGEGRTRLFAQMMKSLGVTPPALFVVDEMDPQVARASRNIPRTAVVRARDVSVYQLLRHAQIVVTRSGLEVLKARLGGEPPAPQADVATGTAGVESEGTEAGQ